MKGREGAKTILTDVFVSNRQKYFLVSFRQVKTKVLTFLFYLLSERQ